MARYLYIFLVLPFLGAPAFAKPEADQGKLSIFRWNQGYRAEREPIFETEMQEPEFRSMVKEGKLPEAKDIYSGCYLAHFEPAKTEKRSPASVKVVKPKSEVFRICR